MLPELFALHDCFEHKTLSLCTATSFYEIDNTELNFFKNYKNISSKHRQLVACFRDQKLPPGIKLHSMLPDIIRRVIN